MDELLANITETIACHLAIPDELRGNAGRDD